MRIRTGIDTVRVDDVQAALEAHGERYLARVYTAAERADCVREDGTPDAERLAARWAAKEAVVKLLRAPEGSFAWDEIGLSRSPDGAPMIKLTGTARALADALGTFDIDVSFTHEAGLATAVAVALIER